MKKIKIITVIAAILLGTSLSQITFSATNNGGTITKQELTTPIKTFPVDLVANANQTQLANYAWRLFIAAMQQTKASLHSGSGRGVGNGVSNFIDTGRKPAAPNPLVFESLYHRTEAFPHYDKTKLNAKPPSPIEKLPVYYTFYKNDNGEHPLVVKKQNYVYLDETNEIGQNLLFYQNSYNKDFPVLFMAKVNQTEASYALNSKRQDPSKGVSWDFPDGVVEVKTAWRRVKDIKHSDPRNYHQASATYYAVQKDRNPVVHTDTFALIAIHIIQKTKNYQQFIFTTFEHVSAVTRDSNKVIIDPAFKTEYNYLSYQTPDNQPHTAVVNGAYSINEQGQPERQNKLTTYTLPTPGTVSQDFITVVQPNVIIKEVNDVNNQVNNLVHSLDKSNIWANYRLKGVQAIPTSDSKSSNFYLANIAVESSQPGVQLFSGILLNGGVPKPKSNGSNTSYFVNCRGDIGGSQCVYPNKKSGSPTTYNNVSPSALQDKPVPTPKFNMGGCQGCHGAAQQLGRDFSFLANGVNGKGKELDSVPADNLSAKQKALINHNMSYSSNFDL